MTYSGAVIAEAVTTYFKLRSFRKAAAACAVSKSTLHTWVQKLGKFIRPPKASCRRSRAAPVVDRIKEVVKQLLQANPFYSALELARECGASPSSVLRAIRLCKLSHQKAYNHYVPNMADIEAKRAAFVARVVNIDPSDILSVDETSFSTHMAPLRGYAPKGQRLVHTTSVKRQRCTATVALSNQGIEAWSVVPGSANKATFLSFADKLASCEQHYILLDNISFHHSQVVLDQARQVVVAAPGGQRGPFPTPLQP